MPRVPRPIRAAVSVETLLAPCSPSVRRLAQQVRAAIGAAVPSLEERLLPGWRAFGYREPDVGRVCTLFPFASELKLYFEHGASLDDPDGLLTGRLKQTSFIVFRAPRDFRKAALQRLVRDAVWRRAV